MGIAHAVMQAQSLLKDKTDLVVVCYADMPLLRGETLVDLVETQKKNSGPMSMLTVFADDPRGSGGSSAGGWNRGSDYRRICGNG